MDAASAVAVALPPPGPLTAAEMEAEALYAFETQGWAVVPGVLGEDELRALCVASRSCRSLWHLSAPAAPHPT